METGAALRDVAIVGMACRFPGADDLASYWQNLCEGKTSITFFSRDELLANGVPASLVDSSDYVKAAAILNDYDKFDAGFFSLPPRVAQFLDPQQRLLLEVAWEAFEDAGYPPENYPGVIGAFTGSGGVVSSYLIDRLLKNPDLLDNTGSLIHLGNDKDFFSTRLSYAFNLTGPSINIQTACSTSITAIHLACQSLFLGECDLALVGTSNVRIPHHQGYMSVKNSIYSPDGYCHPFDENAKGTIFGSGVASIILKPIEKAVADNDNIYAVILASAVNNDGGNKLSFTTTSTTAQAKAIAEAMVLANIEPSDISYIECHGTGTYLGDPLEIQALNQAFSLSTQAREEKCAISSVKGNIGHLDHSAGLASVIKVALGLKNRKIPATANFDKANPKINFDHSPFYVNTKTKDWQTKKNRRVAGVNSLGLGGTNAFALLAEVLPKKTNVSEKITVNFPLIFTVSAKKPEILPAIIDRYVKFLKNNPQQLLADICFTNCVGRIHFKHRQSLVVASIHDLITKLFELKDNLVRKETLSIDFSLGGDINHLIEVSKILSSKQNYFQKSLTKINNSVSNLINVFDVIENGVELTSLKKNQTNVVCFCLEYLITKQWLYWGIEPKTILGNNPVSNLVAACIAEALSFDLVLKQLIQENGISELASINPISAVKTIEWVPTIPLSDYKNQHFELFSMANATNNINQGLSSWQDILEMISEYYSNGCDIKWDHFYENYAVGRISLPTYAFEKKRYWLE